MNASKPWRRSRLVWLGVLTTLLSAAWLTLILTGHSPPSWLLVALGAVWGPLTIWLRKTTTTLLGGPSEAIAPPPGKSPDSPTP